jgi:hypothetical protein
LYLRADTTISRYFRISPCIYFLPREYAVYDAMRWQIHPNIPPLPIQKPGVTINQKIPLRKSPL